jgi:hypothetical protein
VRGRLLRGDERRGPGDHRQPRGHVERLAQPEVADQWGTANPMNELVAKESFNDVDPGVFVAPPV